MRSKETRQHNRHDKVRTVGVPDALQLRFLWLRRNCSGGHSRYESLSSIPSFNSDDELKRLQEELIGNPSAGDLIVGTGGLRKIRMSIGSQGKSGGARVIYFVATKEVIYLVLAYPKSSKASLSATEKASLKDLTKALKEEVRT